jgi:hypothetical protein
MDICRIPQQKDFLLQSLGSVEDSTVGNGQQKDLSPTDPLEKADHKYLHIRNE